MCTLEEFFSVCKVDTGNMYVFVGRKRNVIMHKIEDSFGLVQKASLNKEFYLRKGIFVELWMMMAMMEQAKS